MAFDMGAELVRQLLENGVFAKFEGVWPLKNVYAYMLQCANYNVELWVVEMFFDFCGGLAAFMGLIMRGY